MNSMPMDPVSVYIREACSVQPLTKDEETELFRQLSSEANWDQQQEDAARRLVESRLMLVVNVAQGHSASGVPVLELIQQGNIGLLQAVRSFAERPVGDFTDHASRCIEDAISEISGKSVPREQRKN